MMMIKRLFSMMALLALAACGGGGGSAGTPAFGGGGTPPPAPQPAVAFLVVQLSSDTIANSGTGTVTATITALDSSRVSVPGATVALSSTDNGAVITVAGTSGNVTDATGKIVATVGIGTNRANRDIVLRATAGTVTGTATLKVIDSASGTQPTSIEVIAAATTVGTGGDAVLIRAFVKDVNNNALPSATVSFRTSTGTLSSVATSTDASGSATALLAAGADRSNREATITVSSGVVTSQIRLPITGTRLTLSGPSALILGNTAPFDVGVSDSKGNAVPNVTITAGSSLGNSVVASNDAGNTGAVSNASGQVRFNYTATNPGRDTLVFSGAGSTASPSPALVVSGDDFAFVSPAASTVVSVNVPQVVQVRLRSGGTPQDGRVINFAATGGTLSATSATTASGGLASVSFTSNSAGPVTVQATVSGSATSTTLPLTVVATTPSKLVLQISPTSIAPNVGATSNNQGQVLARVTDASGNPVQGQSVNFTREVDPSGGNLQQASATTDASGQATVTYRSGAESTANNGVRLRATVASNSAVTATATLTVNQSALFIALGTGNVITNLDPQTYRKDWVVYVTDANGIPVNGVTLTIKTIPTYYLTGRLAYNGTVWAYTNPIYSCVTEDTNANGILDSEDTNANGILDPGEDTNGNGVLDREDQNADSVLWPGNVIAVTPGNVQTVDGRATVSLIYAESYAPWVQVRLTASATVAGTESKTDAVFIVNGAAEDFSSESNPPAGVVSPFGASPRVVPATGAFPTSCTLGLPP